MSEPLVPPDDRLSQRHTTIGARPEEMSCQGTSSDPAQPKLHERVGPYRIIGIVGQGGMGVVYLAEQAEPVKRQVALKIIKLGMDTNEVIARFEAERQALALMDHPSIASIYDAGATAEGRSYFVMEYVQGSPITEYCNQFHLTNRERIELFLQVCEGVQHAHQKAVIHRDLKPSNVLVSRVDGRPLVKIIDFGLAKALQRQLTERTLHTELGVMVGTLEYMSPEQTDVASRVDTRSDVFSLGVMLYEVLVGTLPFGSRELRQEGILEGRRKIRELDPPRPSARLSSHSADSTEWAKLRRTEPRVLRRELKGDLDWITMRALEKDPARRYGSPSDLAADLTRFLNFQPVLARAPSARYRALKFMRRHRLGVAATAIIAMVLTAGAIASTVGFVRARQAEVRARTEAEAKRRVADFLKNLFRVSDPSEARGSSITARELLDKAAGTIDTQLSDQPAMQAELAAIMGEVYMNLGLYPQADSLCAKALEIRRRVLGPEHPDTLHSMNTLGSLYGLLDRHDEAVRIASEALDLERRVLGAEHPETLATMMNLANGYLRQGKLAEAEQLYVQALAVQKRVLGAEHPNTLQTMHNLAVTYQTQNRFAEAERYGTEVFETRKRIFGPQHPDTLMSMASLAKLYARQHRNADSERLQLEVMELEKRVLGPEHPDVLTAMTDLALLYQSQGLYEKAEKLDLETLAIQKRVLGPEHSSVLWSMNNLALGYQSRGRLAEAERLHTETYNIRKRVLGPTHPDTLVSIYNLACVAARRGDRAKAMAWLRQDVEGGDIDAEGVSGDAELQSLHGPEFDALLAQVRRNALASRAGASKSDKQ
jgi:non-specific serine/threonine protein kinase/serine/threonine-protein kinase